MKTIQLLIVSGILLLHLQGTFAKGRKKNNELLSDPNVRRSPLFCPLKYELCLKHPKRGSNPTPGSCAERIARKYLCSQNDINRSYTEDEKRQFLDVFGSSNKGSRSFGGGDEPIVDPQEIVDSGTEESSEETAKLDPTTLKQLQSQIRLMNGSPSSVPEVSLSPDELVLQNSDESSSRNTKPAIIYSIMDEPVDEILEDSPVAIPVDSPVAIPTDSPVEIPVDSPVPIPVESSVTNPEDSPVAIPTDSPVEIPVDSPVAIPVDSPVEIPVDSPVEIPVESSVANSEDSPVAIPTDPPVAIPEDSPVAIPTDSPVAIPMDSPAAIPVDEP